MGSPSAKHSMQNTLTEPTATFLPRTPGGPATVNTRQSGFLGDVLRPHRSSGTFHDLDNPDTPECRRKRKS
jgi:hypothetical protein